LETIPFMNQLEYDQLLQKCDLNFVRGEGSLIRAIWAGKPFVWHIYQQEEDAHMIKLQAFLDIYTQDFPEELREKLSEFWLGWNRQESVSQDWEYLEEYWHLLISCNKTWNLSIRKQQDLAQQMVDFVNVNPV
jgi:uncharacterized repeat protein (TIGR03837 family)